MDISKIEINEKFKRALKIMKQGSPNIFVTGRAGTGKSTLLEYFKATTKRDIVVLAPTGVAAVNVGGQTIHSFFRFRPDITPDKAKRIAKRIVKSGDADIYQKIDTVVIDEISMVRADLFDCVDEFLRIARDKTRLPFGGAHIAMIGDLYQLPPVVTSSERRVFKEHYKSPWFFDSRVYSKMDIRILELEKIYRQSDKKFIDLLNAIRNNVIDEEGIDTLNMRLNPDPKDTDSGHIHLTALNRDADAINVRKLAALRGRSRHYSARVSGEFDRKSYPAREDVELKTGAQVMLINNDSMGRWINGTVGCVTKVGSDHVEVKLSDGNIEEIEPYTWQMFRFELSEKGNSIVSQPVGKFTQLPVMLAWAVTIHKSQGKTFDSAVIDVGRVFDCGQVYVALSRLRSLEGITLKTRLKKSHVRVDWRVVNFLTGHQYAKSEKEMPFAEKTEMIRNAIENGQDLAIIYLKANDVKSKRTITPIEVGEMEYSGRKFPGLRAICNTRNDERVFRVDRILKMEVVD